VFITMIMESDETAGGMLCRRKGRQAARTFSTELYAARASFSA
jgi:hypothetical protein